MLKLLKMLKIVKIFIHYVHSLHSNIQLSRTYNNCGIHNLIRRMYRIICLIRVSRIHRNVIVKTKLLCLLIHFFLPVSRRTVQRNSVAKHWKCFIDVTQFNIYVFNNESYFLTTLSYHRNTRIPREASQSFSFVWIG